MIISTNTMFLHAFQTMMLSTHSRRKKKSKPKERNRKANKLK